MKFAICAAGRADAETLTGMLERRLRELCADIDTECFQSTDALLSAAGPGRFAVLLLDADMENGGGLAAAKKLCAKDPGCQLIIFAADAAHALKSYTLHPVGYLIKPLDYDILIRTLDWCRSSWSAGLRSIEVTVRRNTVRLLLTDILYAEVSERSLRIMTRQTEVLTSMSMAEFIRRAEGGPFLRCHKSFVVNLTHATAGGGCFLMDNGASIPISTDRGKAVVAEYAAWAR